MTYILLISKRDGYLADGLETVLSFKSHLIGY
jgi:hypothetical protein